MNISHSVRIKFILFKEKEGMLRYSYQDYEYFLPTMI